MRRSPAASGKRLYGKPLQNLAPDSTILGQILDTMRECPAIETAVLGIAEGSGNQPFVEIAARAALRISSAMKSTC